MKVIIKKLLNPTNLIILIFAVFFFLINKGLVDLDDKVYKNAFNSISTFFSWLGNFYNVWGGRISSMVLTNIFTNLPKIIFRISNTIVLVITILASYKIIKMVTDDWNEKVKNILLIILFCSMFFISIPVINSAMLWICGSTVYLWPIATMLISLIPFISELTGKKIGKQYYVFAMLANIIAAFSEQTSAILIAFGLITLIWCKLEKRKVSKLLIAHYIIIIIISAINLLAPGNAARSYSEEIKWYPSFSNLSLLDKLIQGYIQVANHLINNTTILFSIVAILSSLLIICDEKTKKINKFVAVLPIIYVLAKFIPINAISRLYTFEKFGIYTLYSPKVLVQLIASSFIIILVAVQLIYALKNKKAGFITSIIYCAGLCSGLAISLSPTIYASGNRVYAVTDMLLVLVSGRLWIELFKKGKKNWKILATVVLIIIIAISTKLYINLYTTGIDKIIY